VVNRAVQTPGSLLVAGGTLLGAPLFASWWLFFLGVCAWLVVVGARVRDPRFVSQVLSGIDPSLRSLPAPAALHDPMLRTLAAQIRVARAHVSRVVSDAPDDVEETFHATVTQLDDLEGGAALLIRRADQIGRWLDTVDKNAIRAEIARLETMIARTSDLEARRAYLDAQRARGEQLRAIEEVTLDHERALAAVMRVAAALESLPAALVRLRLLGTQQREDVAGDLDEQLRKLRGELHHAEQTLLESTEDSRRQLEIPANATASSTTSTTSTSSTTSSTTSGASGAGGSTSGSSGDPEPSMA
jgi:hypothetical protein